MLVLLKMMSVALVPTVRPSAIVVPPPSLMRATAAVPVLDALADLGTPSIVNAVFGLVPPERKTDR